MKYPAIKSIIMDKRVINNKSVSMNEDGLLEQSKYFRYCPVKKLKRYRSAFTTEQVNYLEKEFKKFPYIGSANRKEVANVLKITERAIKIWFQNRRMKEKREVGNKETNTDTKNNINAVLSNEKVKVSSNVTSILNNGEQVYHNNCLRIENLEETKYETNQSSSGIKNISAVNNKNDKTILKPKSNPSVNKPTASPKIRNACRIPPQQNLVDKKTSFKHLYHTREPHLKQRNNQLSFQGQKITETAQDLSFNRNKVPTQFYPTQSNINKRISYYCSPQPRGISAMNPGNVIWKPVSILPMMPGMSTPITISHYPGFSLNSQEITKGSCNCHGPPHAVSEQVQCSRLQPQYLIAIPFGNSIQKI